MTQISRIGRSARGRVATAVAALVLAAGTTAAVTLPAHAADSGYWHTSGNTIVNASGQQVHINGVNWYGFETPDMVPHGLWSRDYTSIIDDIKTMGFNVIRLPFCNQMVEHPTVPANIGWYGDGGPINTDLKGLNSLQVMDKIIDYAGQVGLKVILDDHRSEAGESAEHNGLWYTDAYPDSAWVADWVTLARRYADDPAVIGADVRNEPHTPAGVTYANGATWGTGNKATDFRLAAQRAGDAILGVNSDWLIFVEGIGEYRKPDGSTDSTWWGGDLQGVKEYPVRLDVPNRVVYSAHDYGPVEYKQNWFNGSTTCASLDAVWHKYWGYIADNGTAPIWVGEFGIPNSDVGETAAGSEGQWFGCLVDYIKAHPAMGFAYWALNGEDRYGLYGSSYELDSVDQAKLDLLKEIEAPGGGGTPPTTAPPTTAPPTTAPPTTNPPTEVSCSVDYTTTNEWPGGFTANLTITNTGQSTINGWTLGFGYPGDQRITNAWGMTATQQGATVTAEAAAYDDTIAPDQTITGLGMQGTYTTSDAPPTAFTVNGATCD